MKITASLSVLLSILVLSACSSTSIIGEKPGIDHVSLANADQVTNCQSKGNLDIKVLAKIGFLPRSVKDIEANLYLMARNDAVDNGADTLVKGESSELGKRQFKMYKCRP